MVFSIAPGCTKRVPPFVIYCVNCADTYGEFERTCNGVFNRYVDDVVSFAWRALDLIGEAGHMVDERHFASGDYIHLCAFENEAAQEKFIQVLWAAISSRASNLPRQFQSTEHRFKFTRAHEVLTERLLKHWVANADVEE